MLENESIDETLTRFTKIINELSSLGDTINNDQKIRKVIRSPPRAWKVKTITLKELNDREEIDFFGFIRNLKIYEIEMKGREERETPKKKAIAFKVTPSSFDEEELSEDGDENFAMLIRKVGKMFYKKGRQSNFRRGRQKKKKMGPYFYCKNTCHLIADYPSFQATTSKNVHKKKKMMVATWDDSETDSKEEIDAAHVVSQKTERRLL